MIPLASTLAKAYWAILIGVSLYFVVLLALITPWVQREVIFANKIQAWWLDLNKPEQFGFATNQVTPFNFTSPDDETIYAWHILPLGLYAKHKSVLLKEPSGCAQDITQTAGFRLLRDSSDSRLIINFHGNAGTVGQGWRTDSYRALADGSTSNIHILTVDYRGYGLSTGVPSEEGVIIDAISTVEWAIRTAKVPARRIVILGHSLGTAISAAVAEHYVKREIEFAGVILVAPFTNLQNLLSTYSIGGLIPILSPLNSYPALQQRFKSYLVGKWLSADRISNFVRLSKRVRLFIIHSKNDKIIPWRHSNAMFDSAANATVEGGMEMELLHKMKARSTIKIGDGFISTWNGGTDKIITEEVVTYGHHSRILTYAPVTLAVWKAFDLDEN